MIDFVPATPRVKRSDNPRPSFRFSSARWYKKHDEYKKLLDDCESRWLDEKIRVRGTIVTGELYDFILFMTHSFLRPTESEIYALTHRDIAVANDPKRLIITIRKGKTGHRIVNTMPAAVSVYGRMKSRNKEFSTDDFIFFAHAQESLDCEADYPKAIQRTFATLSVEGGSLLKFGAHGLLPAPHGNLYADHSLTGQSKHLQPGQECRDIC